MNIALPAEPAHADREQRQKDVVAALKEALPRAAILFRHEDTVAFECDALTAYRTSPLVVVLPETEAQVAAVLKICHKMKVPVIARGAGTGLSGGAIAREGGIMIAFARMNAILEIDLANERIVVQPGVVNLDITGAVESSGYFFAPDPSSQRACTIGGNVAENSGGPHTLAYGVTTNHVLGLEVVLPDGTVVETGGKETDLPGYDLTGLLTGSEGTMVLVTKVIARLMRKAEAVKTILAIYESNEDAGRTVAEITARAITPVAVEMLDGVMLRMVEEATHAGYPLDAAAVLLIELEGLGEVVEEQAAQIREACTLCGAREFRVARTTEERDLLWKGRKNAFGAVGRVSPTYYVQDGVVPRTKIAPTLHFINEVAGKYGLTISNIFHAGDGNMHPIILFDARKPGEMERARSAGEEILTYCVEAGGSITGEHGVGMEKNELMGKQFPPETLDMMAKLKALFDPDGRLNPGKVLPTGRGCLEIRQKTLAAGQPAW